VWCSVVSPARHIDWGLRDYGTAQWEGGDMECSHVELSNLKRDCSGGVGGGRDKGTRGQQPSSTASTIQYRELCAKCGARRIDNQIGLEKSPEEYVAKMVEVFREVRRILRDDGTLWLNMGDRHASQGGPVKEEFKSILGCSDAMIIASKYDKSRKIADRFPGLKPKDLCMIPARVALALQADGWWLRSVIIWHKPSCMPESVTDRPTTAHEYVYLLAKSESYYYDADAIRESSIDPESISGRRPRNPRQADQSGDKLLVQNIWKITEPIPYRNKRTVWTINPEPTPYAHFATFPQRLVEPCIMAGTSEKGNCGKCGKPWKRVIEHIAGKHSEQASKYQRTKSAGIQSGGLDTTTIGGKAGYNKTTGWQPSCDCGVDPVPPIVLDPFSGSGTVGVVAKKLQRKYVLIDLNAEYNEKIAKPRLAQCEIELAL